jgi:N6-adenosine-specific RNA methylase IME4
VLLPNYAAVPSDDDKLEIYYAERIGAAWRKAVGGIIEAGQILIEAKEALPHGRFLAMVKDRLRMGERTAQRLMAIAGDDWISNPTHVSHLPPSWGALYLITKLDIADRERLISVGCIRPDMQRSDLEEAIRQQEREGYSRRVEAGATVADLEALAQSGKKFGVICPDLPWRFEVYSGKGKQCSAERYYDTWPLERIKAFARDFIPRLAAKNCALLLWSVWPEHPGALEAIAACGFTYKSAGFIWVKTTPKAKRITLDGQGLHWGMGFGTRSNTEACLLATRGKPLRLAADVHQVVIAPVGAHSEKPSEVYRRIERLYPGPYLELFARQPRAGWTTWGNELPPMTTPKTTGFAAHVRRPIDPTTVIMRAWQGGCGRTAGAQ